MATTAGAAVADVPRFPWTSLAASVILLAPIGASDSAPEEARMDFTWVEGGCHCGAVRFSVKRRSENLAGLICNCSICTKKGTLHWIVDEDDFALLAGEDNLQEYRFNTKVARHLFCVTCGVQSYYIPRSHPDMVDVNVRCLDGDMIDAFHFDRFDGRRWEEHIHLITDAGDDQ